MDDKSVGDPASRRRPRDELPDTAFAVWVPELPLLADEIIAAIRSEVPAYSRPLEGAFGVAVHRGVDEALRRFIQRAEGGAGPGEGRGENVYVALGRGEARDGRTLEALLAAYRVGARVAWHRLAAAGVAAGMEPQTLILVAEALFAYIDELSAESADGYAREQAARAGESERRRTECLELLVRDPPVSRTTLDAAADAAQWTLPATLAMLAWPAATGGRPLSRLPIGCLAGHVDGGWCAAVPDPRAPGRRAELVHALGGAAGGLGSPVDPGAAAGSLRRARAALALAREAGELVDADAHRTVLLLRSEPQLLADMARDRLAPLQEETPRSRERLEETLLAWLKQEGNAAAAGEALGVHGQTVRYRLGRLKALFGPQLDDPDVRFELETVLRAREAGVLRP